jgi:hypothetical protein
LCVLRRFYLAAKNLHGKYRLTIVLFVGFKGVAMTVLSGATPAKIP